MCLAFKHPSFDQPHHRGVTAHLDVSSFESARLYNAAIDEFLFKLYAPFQKPLLRLPLLVLCACCLLPVLPSIPSSPHFSHNTHTHTNTHTQAHRHATYKHRMVNKPVAYCAFV